MCVDCRSKRGYDRGILRFAGLWVLVTVAGFLLAAIVDVAVAFPALHLLITWQVQTRGELAVLRELQYGLSLIAGLLGAGLRAAFQAGLLQSRLKLGLPWLVASVAAALVSRLFTTEFAHLLPTPGPVLINHLNAVSAITLISGVIAGLAGWLVLRRLPRAPLILPADLVAAAAAAVIELEVAMRLVGAPFEKLIAAESLAAGLVVGVVQGLALAWILGEPLITSKLSLPR